MDATEDLSWDDVHRSIVPLMRADNRTNLGYLLREYLLLALVVWAGWAVISAWSSAEIGPGLFIPGAAIIVVLAAATQHRLSGLAHDASHYVLFRNRLANELVSDLFLMFPIVAMTQKYRAAHLGHHQYVNDPARDPDLVRLNTPIVHAFPVSKARFWLKYVLKGLWPPTMLGYLFGRAKAANVGAEHSPEIRNIYRVRVARCLRGTYWLCLFTAIHALNAWPVFFLFWVLPLLTVYPLLMQLREIAHHCNAPDDGDLTNSRVFRVNPILAAAVFPYGQAFHLTHHLFAMVPHYRVAEAHRLLLRYRPYRESVVVCRGYFFRTVGTAGPSVLDELSKRRSEPWLKGPTRRTASSQSVDARARRVS